MIAFVSVSDNWLFKKDSTVDFLSLVVANFVSNFDLVFSVFFLSFIVIAFDLSTLDADVELPEVSTLSFLTSVFCDFVTCLLLSFCDCFVFDAFSLSEFLLSGFSVFTEFVFSAISVDGLSVLDGRLLLFASSLLFSFVASLSFTVSGSE